MSSAGAPLASAPVAAVLYGAAPVLGPPPPPPVATQSAEPGVWLADIVVTPPAVIFPAPVAPLPIAMAPVPAADRPGPQPGQEVPVLRVSDRGWLGEPEDSVAPNAAYAGRLVEPPAIERRLPIYPDESRRLAVSAGELRLANGDGRLDPLAGDWTVAGRLVALRRGPHRRPRHAPFTEMVTVATLRAGSAAAGTATLALPLRAASADLDVPACQAYAGSGGAEGPERLKGQNKPRVLGRRRNIVPVLVDPGLLLHQVHDGPTQAIDAVRDRGVALTNAGDHADYAALAAAVVASGTYRTCLALGLFRVGATPSLLTCDVQGDAATATGGYAGGSAVSIARKLLAGAGVAGFDAARFAWPVGECGLWLQGGSVADAMDRLAGGIGGWWGPDSFGAYEGGVLEAPESVPVGAFIEPQMLAAPPEEIGTPRAPWWRVRVGARVLGRVQSGEELAGAVGAEDRQIWGQPSTVVSASDLTVSSAYALAEDPPVVDSAFDLTNDAQAVADAMLALFRLPRRLFQAPMRPGGGGYAWPTMRLGACVSLRWPPRLSLAGGRPLIVVGVSARGDATTLTLWG